MNEREDKWRLAGPMNWSLTIQDRNGRAWPVAGGKPQKAIFDGVREALAGGPQAINGATCNADAPRGGGKESGLTGLEEHAQITSMQR